MRRRPVIAFLPVAIGLLLGTGAQACGIERWPVKVGTDADAGKVDLTPRRASVAILGDIPAPPHPNRRPSSRYPYETRTYTISGVVSLIKAEDDQDWHVVIKDGERTMIVELPSSDCTHGSRFEASMAEARRKLDEKLQQSGLRGKGPYKPN